MGSASGFSGLLLCLRSSTSARLTIDLDLPDFQSKLAGLLIAEDGHKPLDDATNTHAYVKMSPCSCLLVAVPTKEHLISHIKI